MNQLDQGNIYIEIAEVIKIISETSEKEFHQAKTSNITSETCYPKCK